MTYFDDVFSVIRNEKLQAEKWIKNKSDNVSLILEIKACFGKLRIVLRCANIQTFTNKQKRAF